MNMSGIFLRVAMVVVTKAGREVSECAVPGAPISNEYAGVGPTGRITVVVRGLGALSYASITVTFTSIA